MSWVFTPVFAMAEIPNDLAGCCRVAGLETCERQIIRVRVIDGIDLESSPKIRDRCRMFPLANVVFAEVVIGSETRRFETNPVTMQEALTLGGDKLAVDGVILIGEHGDYPVNDKAQTLYPRFEMFLKITDVFRQSGRSVPVFNDKHLSYS